MGSQRCKKRKKAADALRWTMDIIKEMNSEATKAICKLCKGIAKDSSFIPENLKLTFLVSGSFPIAIYTIFYKLISSAIMNNIKEHLPGIFSLVQFCACIQGGAEDIIHDINNILGDHLDWTLVSLNLSNAFNSVSRDTFISKYNKSSPVFLLDLSMLWPAFSRSNKRG